jgi:divalent metal cation (Fe/Co/Zn/Cd) transporter
LINKKVIHPILELIIFAVRKTNAMNRQMRLVLLSLITGIVLMLIKFIAYFITESNAIFSDAAESLVNIVASGFA